MRNRRTEHEEGPVIAPRDVVTVWLMVSREEDIEIVKGTFREMLQSGLEPVDTRKVWRGLSPLDEGHFFRGETNARELGGLIEIYRDICDHFKVITRRLTLLLTTERLEFEISPEELEEIRATHQDKRPLESWVFTEFGVPLLYTTELEPFMDMNDSDRWKTRGSTLSDRLHLYRLDRPSGSGEEGDPSGPEKDDAGSGDEHGERPLDMSNRHPGEGGRNERGGRSRSRRDGSSRGPSTPSTTYEGRGVHSRTGNGAVDRRQRSWINSLDPDYDVDNVEETGPASLGGTLLITSMVLHRKGYRRGQDPTDRVERLPDPEEVGFKACESQEDLPNRMRNREVGVLGPRSVRPGYRVRMKVRNASDERRRVRIPQGLAFEVELPELGVQCLVSTREHIFDLGPGEDRDLVVKCFCANRSFKGPVGSPMRVTPYRTIGNYDSQAEVWAAL